MSETGCGGRVLITGAAGFSGRHLVKRAVEAGLEVVATDVSPRYYGSMFEALAVEFRAADLTQTAGLGRLLEGVDAVFHLAGADHHGATDAVMFASNVECVENVCKACVDTGVRRFIHFSSAAVYGFGRTCHTPAAEDTRKLGPPINNYNRSKWEGERLLHRYQAAGLLKTTVLRPATVYGPGSEYGLYDTFRRVYEERNKKRLTVIGLGGYIEGFVHVEDLCRAAIWAYGNDDTIGEAYNVADDSRMSTAELFRLICREMLGREKELNYAPAGLVIPLAAAAEAWAKLTGTKPKLEKRILQYPCCNRILDNRKLKSAGFELLYPDVEEGLAQTIAWYRENGWLPPTPAGPAS